MKKLISVVLALAMILSLGAGVFAYEAPAGVNSLAIVGASIPGVSDWTPGDPAGDMELVADNVYEKVIEVTGPITMTVKFAGNDKWDDSCNLGGSYDGDPITIGEVKNLTNGSGAKNMSLVVDEACTLKFTVDMTAGVNAATVMVEKVVAIPEPSTYELVNGVPQNITIPAGGSAYIVVDATASNMKLNVSGTRMNMDWVIDTGRMQYSPNMGGFCEMDLPAGMKYTMTLINNNADVDAMLEVTASAPVAGTRDNPAELAMGENVAEIAENDRYFYIWTAAEDGKLTLSINTDVCSDWSIYVEWVNENYVPSSTEILYSDVDPVVSTLTVDVTAGTEYNVIVGSANYNATVVSFDASFVAGEVGGEDGGETGGEDGGETGGDIGGEKEEYIISDTNLVVGENNVTMEENAENTLFNFEPTETGVYVFTAPEGVQLGHWNNSNFPLDMTFDKTNTFEWECTSVGQSILLGVVGSEDTTITVTKEGSGSEIVDIEYEEYENVHTPSEENMVDVSDKEIIDVDITKPQTVVKDENGFYHLGTVDGPVLYVNLTAAEFNMVNAILNQYGAGAMRGEYDSTKYEFINAMREYAELVDKAAINNDDNDANDNGLYPLTDDLMIFTKGYGALQGWFMSGYSVFDEINAEHDAESAWLVNCCYLEDAPAEENPGAGDYSIAGLVVAMMAATAGAVVIGKKKEF